MRVVSKSLAFSAPDAQDKMKELLLTQSTEGLLQPGQIRHLARNFRTDRTVAEWIRTARYDSNDLGDGLCADSVTRDVLAALRMLASTTVPVMRTELFYVLSDTHELPGKRAEHAPRWTSTGKVTATFPVFPVYQRDYTEGSAHAHALDELENRGFVVVADNGYRFSHPSYIQAAERAFHSATFGYTARLVAMCRRGLYCLSPRNAARALDAFDQFESVRDGSKFRSQLVEFAAEALDESIFPAVRDKAVVWMLAHRLSWGSKLYTTLLKHLRSTRGHPDDVVWRDGEAWFDSREDVAFDDPHTAGGDRFRWLRNAAPPQSAALHTAPPIRLAPEVVWRLLTEVRLGDVDPTAIDRGLQYEETFIRAQAAMLAMLNDPSRTDWADRIVDDNHPLVFAAGLRGLLHSWKGADQSIRRSRLAHFLSNEVTPERATVILGLLERFEEVGNWFGNSGVPAEPWVLLAAAALATVSEVDRVDAGHLYHYAKRTLLDVAPEVALCFVNAWLNWAERAVQARWCTDDTVSVGCLIFFATSNNAPLRAGLVGRLLRQQDTAFFVNAVDDVMQYWSELDASERLLLLDALRSSRADSRWARAYALMRSPPPPVVEAILGSEEGLREMLRGRAEPVDRRLLGDCIRVYDDIGTGLSVRMPILQLVVRLSVDPGHPLFERALRYCLEDTMRKQGLGLWRKCMWPKLCNRPDESLRERLFIHLLNTTCTVNSGHFDELWPALLEAADSESIDRWAEIITSKPYLEAIDSYDNTQILFRHRPMGTAIGRRLVRDERWLRAHNLDFETEQLRLLVTDLYDNGAPRLECVHHEILKVLGAAPGGIPQADAKTDPLVKRVLDARSNSIHSGFEWRQAIRSEIEGRLPVEDWVQVSQNAVRDS